MADAAAASNERQIAERSQAAAERERDDALVALAEAKAARAKAQEAATQAQADLQEFLDGLVKLCSPLPLEVMQTAFLSAGLNPSAAEVENLSGCN
jgi:hypothetical protein